MGGSVSGAGVAEQTAKFTIGAQCAVFADDGRRVEAGSGEQGMVAVGGYIPLGYYKDEAKTAQTSRTFEGVRWSVPGDFAEIDADGSLKLLGRGSVCINTGGEEVFPEEVEEALRTHPLVRDPVAVGLPDPRFGETICAVVEAVVEAEGDATPTLAELSDHVKLHLAAYKAPRHVVLVPSILRAPNGKVDYKRLKGLAVDQVGATTGIGQGSGPSVTALDLRARLAADDSVFGADRRRAGRHHAGREHGRDGQDPCWPQPSWPTWASR